MSERLSAAKSNRSLNKTVIVNEQSNTALTKDDVVPQTVSKSPRAVRYDHGEQILVAPVLTPHGKVTQKRQGAFKRSDKLAPNKLPVMNIERKQSRESKVRAAGRIVML